MPQHAEMSEITQVALNAFRLLIEPKSTETLESKRGSNFELQRFDARARSEISEIAVKGHFIAERPQESALILRDPER